jgi:hypothetical protein
MESPRRGRGAGRRARIWGDNQVGGGIGRSKGEDTYRAANLDGTSARVDHRAARHRGSAARDRDRDGAQPRAHAARALARSSRVRRASFARSPRATRTRRGTRATRSSTRRRWRSCTTQRTRLEASHRERVPEQEPRAGSGRRTAPRARGLGVPVDDPRLPAHATRQLREGGAVRRRSRATRAKCASRSRPTTRASRSRTSPSRSSRASTTSPANSPTSDKDSRPWRSIATHPTEPSARSVPRGGQGCAHRAGHGHLGHVGRRTPRS